MRTLLLFCGLIFPCCVPSLTAQSLDSVERNAEFLAVPASIHQADGKYPDSHIVLFRTACSVDNNAAGNNQLATPGDGESYSATASGAGYTLSNVRREDNCSISFDLKVSGILPDAVAVKISLVKKSIAAPVGTAFLHLADPKSGPIPTATPQVDVLWAPISFDVCKKAFGSEVANKFYCIGLTIGNNTGYQLQIAGVGFETPYGKKKEKGKKDEELTLKTPSSSYAITRAVAQEHSFQTTRSYLVNGTEALGLFMTSLTPYFTNATSRAKYATATNIVTGPLGAVFNLLVPDSSQRQANNLDDQSLRDGKLIPNNTQIRTVVFLDKGSVELDYKPGCDGFFSEYDIDAQSDINIDTDSHDAKKKKKFLNDIPSARQADLKDAGTFGIHTATWVAAKIGIQDPDDAEDYKSCVAGASSTGLKLALGKLLLVGDEINYVQRIVVDQSVQSQEVAASVHVDGSSVYYSQLIIQGKNLTPLAATLQIQASGNKDAATRDDTKSSSTAAVYTIKPPISANTAYTVLASGTSLPADIKETSKSLPITGVSLSASSFTITGTMLDLLPDSISIVQGATTIKATKGTASSGATPATYTSSDDTSNLKADKVDIKDGSGTLIAAQVALTK